MRMAPMTSELPEVNDLCVSGMPFGVMTITEDSSVWLLGWMGIPQVTMVTKVTTVTEAAGGFLAQSLRRADTHAVLHVM
jgi:hypothetical protein